MVGNRLINLTGTFITGVFIAASGGAKTGIQFIVLRAMQGIGAAMAFPTAISILTAAFAHGKTRNIAISCLGFGQPFGFQVGLLLSGAFVDSRVTWRFPFYVCGATTLVLFACCLWFLPQDRARAPVTWTRMVSGFDWIGVLVSSTSLGLLSYVLV